MPLPYTDLYKNCMTSLIVNFSTNQKWKLDITCMHGIHTITTVIHVSLPFSISMSIVYNRVKI